MDGLALCLPRVGQPQGLPVPHEILKTPEIIDTVVETQNLAPLLPFKGNYSGGTFARETLTWTSQNQKEGTQRGTEKIRRYTEF